MNPSFELHSLCVYLQQASPLIYPNSVRKWHFSQQTLSAVLHDFWQECFGTLPAPEFTQQIQFKYISTPQDLSALMLILWFLKAEAFKQIVEPEQVKSLLLESYPDFIALIPAESFLFDAERQEELLRFCLRHFDWGIQGESAVQSEERWQQISTQAEQKLLQALQAHRKRQAAIKQAQAHRSQQW